MTLYIDAAQPIDARTNDLLSQMTLDEKLAQIVGVWVTALFDNQRQYSDAKAREVIPDGVGQITRIGAASLMQPRQTAAIANAVQKFLKEQTRLAIPAMVHEESCAGYMARGATTFPQAIGLAAMWEPDLIEAMTQVIRRQMRTVGAHHALAPVLDVVRDARWGRVEETFGEDPFLITQCGLAYVYGIQGDDLSQGVAATGKHFVAHGLPEGGMNWAPVHVGARELRDIFAMPFQAVIRDAKIATIMNAYHELDGEPCGGSRAIMTDFLRDELGFDGVVVSDYFTLDTLRHYHYIAHDKQEAARVGLEAGIDIELPARDCYGDPLREALEAGDISIDLVDTAVKRVLKLKFQLGLFENPFIDEGRVPEILEEAPDRQLSRTMAQKSMVLLKNEGDLLPLDSNIKSIAVIGPNADSVRLLQGDYHYPGHLESLFQKVEINDDAPMPVVNHTTDDINDHFIDSVTVLAGIKNRISGGTQVHYAKGCENLDADTSGFDAAIQAARQSDVVIMVVGDRSGLAIGGTVGESLDRVDLHLPGVQQQLVEAIHATGKPIVMVLLNGRPVELTWAAENIPAIVEAWLPAQEGGNAIADVLFGDVSPSGKLPMSFPRSVGQVPMHYNHKPSGGRSHWKGDYVDSSTKPLFPFGYGLSYTQFEFSNLSISTQQATAYDTVHVSVEVKNTGKRAGEEVVQLYLQDVVGSLTRPVKELKGFKRVSLEAGESKTVVFAVPVSHMAFYNRDLDLVVEPGTIRVMVGSSSEDTPCIGEFEIIGNVTSVERTFVTEGWIQ